MRVPNLRGLRERASLTQAALAARAGVSLTSIWRGEAGGRLRWDSVCKLAAALDLAPADLTGRGFGLPATSQRQLYLGRLREARLRAGLTQRQLALRAGVTTHTIYWLETVRGTARPETIERLATELDVRPGGLTGAD
jgi:transcriptional regulator with XRE-family HTH domain